MQSTLNTHFEGTHRKFGLTVWRGFPKDSEIYAETFSYLPTKVGCPTPAISLGMVLLAKAEPSLFRKEDGDRMRDLSHVVRTVFNIMRERIDW